MDEACLFADGIFSAAKHLGQKITVVWWLGSVEETFAAVEAQVLPEQREAFLLSLKTVQRSLSLSKAA